MNFTRLLLLFVVALVGVIAQNVYLNRLADLFKRVNGFTQQVPALKACVEGIPLDVDSWVKMDTPARKAKLQQLDTQTYNTLLKLTKEPNVDAQKLLDFDATITEVTNVIVEGTQTDQLTATPSMTTPAPTTAAPATTTPAPPTEKPKETTEAPKSTDAPTATQKSESSSTTTSSGSGSSNTDIDTVAVESVAPTTAPKAAASKAPAPAPASGSAALRLAVPALIAMGVTVFFAM